MAAGVYLHIPFCRSRCSYCDFATDIYRDADIVAAYVDAVCREVDNFTTPGIEADTIYFGGGTPSLLRADQVAAIIGSVRGKFAVSDDAEITLEMNPGTVTPEVLAGFREVGVDRASFGVQTFDDRDLKLLARGHDSADSLATFRMLRDAGFDNVSFDLIAGLPGQSFEQWQRNLDAALSLSPEHLSLYLLELHAGTPLEQQVAAGRRPAIDEDLAAAMYTFMLDRLAEAGYEQYEISNFSKAGFESRHNIKYWRMDPVYGFGVSAHSFDGRRRYANERVTDKYLDLCRNGSPIVEDRTLTDDELAGEFIFLNLRLTRGLSIGEYRDRFGRDVLDEHKAAIDDLTTDGLIVLDEGHIRLTRRGMLYSNNVFSAFI